MINDDRLRALLHEVLDERPRIDAESHAEHHEFIRQWIERERIKAERWEDIRRQLMGWCFIASIGSLGLWAQQYIGTVLRTVVQSMGIRL